MNKGKVFIVLLAVLLMSFSCINIVSGGSSAIPAGKCSFTISNDSNSTYVICFGTFRTPNDTNIVVQTSVASKNSAANVYVPATQELNIWVEETIGDTIFVSPLVSPQSAMYVFTFEEGEKYVLSLDATSFDLDKVVE